jgi:hypothetical protein
MIPNLMGIVMLRSSNLSLAAFAILAVAFSIHANGADLSTQDASAIENSARRIGETVVDQGHSAADVRKIVTFYVQGEVGRALHPTMPEAPLPADEANQVKAIVDKVMASLHLVDPVDPQPNPLPKPVRPAGPVDPPQPRPSPQPGPGPQPGNQPGLQPVYVWVVTPSVQPAPVPWPPAMPVAPVVPGFAPMPGWPGPAATIHIKHGWFGHPDKVWYSRH